MNLPVLKDIFPILLHTFCTHLLTRRTQIQCAVSCDVGGLEDTLIKQPDVYDFFIASGKNIQTFLDH